MNSRFRSFVEEVRSASDLVDVISADVELKSSGSVLKGLSPFNSEKTPSFVVWPVSQSWQDYSNGGGLGGDVFAYLQRRENCSFKEALCAQAQRVSVKNPFGQRPPEEELALETERRAVETLHSKAAAYYHQVLPDDVREKWLRSRYGFTDETIDELQFGWANSYLQGHFINTLKVDRGLALKTGLFVIVAGGGMEDFFKNRLVFPYWKRGRVVYFIARSTERTEDVAWEKAKYKKLLTYGPDKFSYVSKTVRNDFFYNEDAAGEAESLLVTEGVTDCISSIQAKIPCISPVTTRFRARDVAKFLELTRKTKRIVICNDSEASGAGLDGALETARVLHKEGRKVFIAELPRAEGVEKVDINEFVKEHGASALQELCDKAPKYIDHLLAGVPDDTKKEDLESLLEPAVAAIRSSSLIEQEGYVEALAKRFKVGKRVLSSMLRDARAEPAKKEKRSSVLGRLVDAPVSANHVVPFGWYLGDSDDTDEPAISKVIESREGVSHVPMCSRPVVLSAWVNNRTTGSKMLEVSWRAQGKWRSAIVDRNRLFDGSKIVEALAGWGFPVSSGNRAEMVNYLASYESANVGALPVRVVSEQMGWTSKKRDQFLCGSEVIGGGASGETVSFRPAGEGEAQLVDSLQPRGSLEAWAQAIATVAQYPRVMLGVYASFATPLLELLELPGFTIDWSNRTTTGKTVVLRAAASVWGNPDERSGSSLIQTWNSTLVGFERHASARRNIPIILDDTRTARSAKMVAEMLYQATAGHGRTRGAIQGARKATSWRTILLSTGERKATDFTKDAGSVVRCLSLWGNPFGGVSKPIADTIAALERCTFRNHGHAGPAFVRWLVDQDHDAISQRFCVLHDQISEGLRDQFDAGMAARVSHAVAVVELAGLLAHEALPLPWDYSSPWQGADSALVPAAEALQDADRAADAVNAAYDWAVTRIERFYGARERMPSPDKWAGVWKNKEYFGFTGLQLREIMDSAGFEFDPIVRQWAERGWLITNSGRKKRMTKTIKVDGICGNYYTLNLVALEGVVSDSNDVPWID